MGADNPYLAEARAACFGRPDYAALGEMLADIDRHELMAAIDERLFARDRLAARYAWAIPNDAALDEMARNAPLLEIGAGTGYWASLLRARGVDILAYDIHPPTTNAHRNAWHRNERGVGTVWTEVRRGGSPQAARYPDRTLVLCWPPYANPMAARCLRAYQGQTVVSIGEDKGGCTADDTFHAALASEWECVNTVDIPQWWGIHDYLATWRRKCQGCE